VRFLWPAALWALAAVPIAIVAAALLVRRRSRHAAVLPTVDVLLASAPRPRRWPQRLAAALFVLAIAVLVLALGRPEMPFLAPREDATVVLVLDTSGSMVADDVEPTRLDAATDAARTFVATVPERLRVGLVRFSDEAEVLAWPSTDRNLVREALHGLEPEGSTAIGEGLVRALRTTGLVDAGGRPLGRRTEEHLHAVLLLSDGRNTAGETDPIDAAALAREVGVPVYTVALAPAAAAASESAPADPVDLQTLRRIAGITGADTYPVHDRSSLDAVYRDLGSRMGFVQRRQEVTFVFAGVAAVLLAGATAMTAVRTPATP
jgi:Ca-activated chloride channel family protein